MAQKATGKSKVIRTGPLPMGKTPPLKPCPQNPSGKPKGKKRQAPSVTVS